MDYNVVNGYVILLWIKIMEIIFFCDEETCIIFGSFQINPNPASIHRRQEKSKKEAVLLS